MTEDRTTVHKVATATDILLRCGGFDLTIIERCSFHERYRCATIGGTVLFTSIFALLASFYAFYTIFRNPYLSALLAFLWALMIFNLDRYIVSSLVKTRNGTFNTLIVLPRLFLALAIAVTIAVPLELLLFEEEIEAYLVNQQLNRLEEMESNASDLLDKAREARDKRVKELQDSISSTRQQIATDIATIQAPVEQAKATADHLEKNAICELNGLCGSGRQGNGPLYREINRKFEDASRLHQDLLEKALKQTESLRTELSNFVSQRAEEIKKAEKEYQDTVTQINESLDNTRSEISAHSSRSFLARVEALFSLSRKQESLAWVILSISSLFLFVESAPALIKLLTPRAEYDVFYSNMLSRAYNEEKEVNHSHEEKQHNRRLEESRWSSELEFERHILSAWHDLKSDHLAIVLGKLKNAFDKWNETHMDSEKIHTSLTRTLDQLFSAFEKSVLLTANAEPNESNPGKREISDRDGPSETLDGGFDRNVSSKPSREVSKEKPKTSTYSNRFVIRAIMIVLATIVVTMLSHTWTSGIAPTPFDANVFAVSAATLFVTAISVVFAGYRESSVNVSSAVEI